MNETTQIETAARWLHWNREYIDAQVSRLRLLLHRRVLWLRSRWSHDSAQDYMAWRISDAQVDWLFAGEDRQAEARFYDTEPVVKSINESLDEVEQQIAGLSQNGAQLGMLAGIDLLALRFGLSRFERDVLLLAMLPALDPSFERIYAYVQDDMTRRYATAQLAFSLFLHADDNPHDARLCFSPEATLRRYRLLSLDEHSEGYPASSYALRVDERIINFVLGSNQLDDRLKGILTPVAPALLSSAEKREVLAAQNWLQSATGRACSVNLLGGPETNRLGLGQAICEGMGTYLLQVNAAGLASSTERDKFTLIHREAVLLQAALYLDVESCRPDDRAHIVRELESNHALLFLASSTCWQGERETFTVRLSKPQAQEQAEMWQEAVAQAGIRVNGRLGALVEQFDLSSRQITRTIAAARQMIDPQSCGDEETTADSLWRACAEQVAPQLNQAAQRIVPSYSWDDIVLPREIRHLLEDLAAQVEFRGQVYNRWGFAAKLNRGRGISALFSGCSGTGKTMAAEVLAQHLKLDLYRIDLAGVVSKYIGETEKNLRQIFDAAESGGVILFFDEADALFGKRSEVKDSHDRYANIEVNYLLQRMEEFRGLAILATNRKSSLDSAFLRRLRFIIEFPFPDRAQRALIWQKVFPHEAGVQGLDYDWLSRLEIAGGHIRNIALAAAFLAARGGTPIGMSHVMRAARREFTKMERVLPEAEFAAYDAAVLQ